MSIDAFLDFVRDEWEKIRKELLAGTYQTSPVRRVEIPKATGGTRPLGIPIVLDRLIQQAIAQVLSPMFDPTFSDASFGFRPGRSAHHAVYKAREYIREGYRIAVDMDLSKFFDTVNHDVLMHRVARKVRDKRVLRLIGKYLRAGVMVKGRLQETPLGVPQGGPLSPLLANVILDDLDKELEKRGHRFARYADDCAGEEPTGGRTGHGKLETLSGMYSQTQDQPGEEPCRPDKSGYLSWLHFPWKQDMLVGQSLPRI